MRWLFMRLSLLTVGATVHTGLENVAAAVSAGSCAQAAMVTRVWADFL